MRETASGIVGALNRQLLLFCSSVLIASVCFADTYYWIREPSSPGDWLDGLNWSSGSVPEAPDHGGEINNGGTAQIINEDAHTGWLYMGNGAQQEPGPNGFNGTLEQEGGHFQVDSTLCLGATIGLSGQYLLKSGAELWVGEESVIGGSGYGTFEHLSGTHTVDGTLYLAQSAYWGRYNLYEGSLHAESEIIGGQGNLYVNADGMFSQHGGTNTISGCLYLGSGDFSKGAYNLENGQLSVENDEYVNRWGSGIFNQNGGIHMVNGNLFVGYELSHSIYPDRQYHGEFNLTDGELSVDGVASIGYYNGQGSFNQSGGTFSVVNGLEIGTGAEHGLYTISGGYLSTSRCLIAPNGEFVIEGGNTNIQFETFFMSSEASFVTELDADWTRGIFVDGEAHLEGNWEVQDLGVTTGRFNVLEAREGVLANFDSVLLPGSDWNWGVENGTILWVEQVPEPATILLLGLGGMLLRRRRKLSYQRTNVGLAE